MTLQEEGQVVLPLRDFGPVYTMRRNNVVKIQNQKGVSMDKVGGNISLAGLKAPPFKSDKIVKCIVDIQ